MPATLGYQAGVEANQTQLSYGVEVTWGARPLVQFQAIRYMSDTLALTKTRQRPSEINVSREVSQALTTQQVAGGTINYALSYGSYDDFFASLMQNDWTPPFAIASIGADITMTSTGTTNQTLSSTLATKFTSINVGQYIRVSGFTTIVQYNNWWRVTAKADNSHITVNGNAVGAATETSSGANVLITGSTLNNGTTFKSLYVQQKFSSNKFLRYGGTYVTRITLGTSVGNFFTGAIDVVAQSEISATVEASTGAALPAPSGPVIDPVSGFVKILYNAGAIVGLLDQLSLTLENTGAAPEFSLGGTAGADGMLGGTFTASGAFRMYCKDFIIYDRFQTEFSADMQIYLQDAAKNSYVLSFQQVVLFCKINATGPGTALFVDVTFEVNPDPVAGGTFQIDRNPTPN
jgi:hypothetical protein